MYEHDPRFYEARRRVEKYFNKVIAYASPKGGVGKTILASITALVLGRKGYKVALIDLDFTNPCTHIVLGINPSLELISEEKGIVPANVDGIQYMSIALFASGKPIALRGKAISNTILEILSMTNWRYKLDLAIIDMPPGTRDEIQDLVNIAGEKLEVIIVTTPSLLAVKAAKNLIKVLKDAKVSIMGIIENMSDRSGPALELAREENIRYLGNIPFDNELEKIIGDRDKLVQSRVARHVEEVISKLISLL